MSLVCSFSLSQSYLSVPLLLSHSSPTPPPAFLFSQRFAMTPTRHLLLLLLLLSVVSTRVLRNQRIHSQYSHSSDLLGGREGCQIFTVVPACFIHSTSACVFTKPSGQQASECGERLSEALHTTVTLELCVAIGCHVPDNLHRSNLCGHGLVLFGHLLNCETSKLPSVTK